MVKNEILVKIGSWSFIIGIVIAGFVGLYQAVTLENGDNFLATGEGVWVAWALAIIGAVVGLLAALGKGTITKNEVQGFLMAGIALVVMYGVFEAITLKPWLGSLLHGVSMSIAIFVAPAVGLLAIRSIWEMGKDV